MFLIDLITFPSNPTRVELDFYSFVRLILIASKVDQNMILVELPLSTNSRCIVKFATSSVIISTSSCEKCVVQASSAPKDTSRRSLGLNVGLSLVAQT